MRDSTLPSIERPVADSSDSVHALRTDLPGPRRHGLRKLLAVLLLGVAFGAGWLLAGGGERKAKDGLPAETGLARRDSAAVMVTAEPVAFRPVQRSVDAVGSLHGFEEVTIAARVEGRVRRLCFDVADCVRPGDLLLEVDSTDYDLSVRQAERAVEVELAKLGLKDMPGKGFAVKAVPTVAQAGARLQNLKNKMLRVEKLWEARATTSEDWENARAEHAMGEAEYANQMLVAHTGLANIEWKLAALAVARQQLKDARVCVPTPTLAVPGAEDGITYAVTQRAVAEGSLVRSGTEVCKLVINRTLKLRAPVPERYSLEIRPGQKVEVKTAALPGAVTGTVARINPSVDPATRTFEVEIQVPNAEGNLKPGSFAKVAILTRVETEVATVPLSSLVTFAGITKIFLIEAGSAREVQVVPGVQSTAWVEIASPALPRGSRVVTSGQTALADRTPVVLRDQDATRSEASR